MTHGDENEIVTEVGVRTWSTVSGAFSSEHQNGSGTHAVHFSKIFREANSMCLCSSVQQDMCILYNALEKVSTFPAYFSFLVE